MLTRKLQVTRIPSFVCRHTHFVHHYSWRKKRCRYQENIGFIRPKNQSNFRQRSGHKTPLTLKTVQYILFKVNIGKSLRFNCRNECTNHGRPYMTEILPIRRKTLYNQSINQQTTEWGGGWNSSYIQSFIWTGFDIHNSFFHNFYSGMLMCYRRRLFKMTFVLKLSVLERASACLIVGCVSVDSARVMMVGVDQLTMNVRKVRKIYYFTLCSKFLT